MCVCVLCEIFQRNKIPNEKFLLKNGYLEKIYTTISMKLV